MTRDRGGTKLPSRGGAHRGDVLRLALGAVITAACALLVTGRPVGRFETDAFRVVNRLPAFLEAPLWVVMQAGSLAAIAVAAGAAFLWGRRRLAVNLAIGGTIAWIAAKLAKVAVARGRPATLLADVLLRGSEQVGLGFPSGHVTVAAALATIAAQWLPRPWRLVAWCAVAVVGLARMYVGAHLPGDALGGAALGVAIGAAVRLCDDALGSGQRNR